jgi:hypothetical protein
MRGKERIGYALVGLAADVLTAPIIIGMRVATVLSYTTEEIVKGIKEMKTEEKECSSKKEEAK